MYTLVTSKKLYYRLPLLVFTYLCTFKKCLFFNVEFIIMVCCGEKLLSIKCIKMTIIIVLDTIFQISALVFTFVIATQHGDVRTYNFMQWRSQGVRGAGRTGRHLLGATNRRSLYAYLKNPREHSYCKFHMCLHAIKTKQYSQCVPIVGTVGYNMGSSAACGSTLLVLHQFRVRDLRFKQLSRFQNLRRKGGKFDHRPRRPEVLLRHRFYAHFSGATVPRVFSNET